MKAIIEWHEIKYRKPTKEEKEEFEAQYGTECCFWCDCELPSDNSEVLIATKYGTSICNYSNDDFGVCFEDWDIEEVYAWAELPIYEKEQLKGE